MSSREDRERPSAQMIGGRAGPEEHHRELVTLLSGRDVQPCHIAVQRTRRAVREAALKERERRQARRRSLGTACAVVSILFVLLGPLLWSGVDEIFGGGYFGDFHVQAAFLLLLLFAATLSALAVGWRTQEIASRPFLAQAPLTSSRRELS